MNAYTQGITILLIEDNLADQRQLTEQLYQTGLPITEIVFATTIAESIRLIQQRAFSIILLNLYLSDSVGMQSFVAVSQVKSCVPVIVLSSLADTTLFLKVINSGAQDVLVKGRYTIELMERTIRFSIERKKNHVLLDMENERNNIISTVTNDISWDWDLQTKQIKWSGAGLKKYLPAGTRLEDVPADFWVNGLHPDERNATIIRLQRTILKGGGVWEGDNRFLCNDGSYAHINTRGYILTNADRRPVRIIGCIQNITDRKNAELEAKEARQVAENAMQAQEQFLINISHEIRTPMNGVIGMAQLLALSALTREQREILDTISQSSNHLMGIINDILDLTKISAGRFTIDENDYNLVDVVRKSVQFSRYKAVEKGLLLKSHIDHTIFPVLLGDPTRLNQVLLNLISNAIKFTESGEVNVHVSLLEDKPETVSLEFSVTDTGIGIAEAHQQMIFERFTQVSDTSTRKYSGTGLGLTITKQLIELQGGTIDVVSEPGKGSSFVFSLDIKKGNCNKIQLAGGTFGFDKTLKGIRILLVEDNVINQKVAVKILSNEGATVEIANNGKEAVGILKKNSYDIVLMDIQMPEMDGYETTNFIRNELTVPVSNTPIIAMTASALLSEKNKCIIAGMDDYITKPFQAQELFEKIREQVYGIA